MQPWEVTTSDYQLSIGNIIHNWKQEYGVDESTVEQIADELDSIRDDLQERLDNMPEGLQEGDVGQILQDRIDGLDSAIDELNNIDVEGIKSEIVEVLLLEEDFICIPKGSDEDYDIIYEHNPRYQTRMSEDFKDNLESQIDSALDCIEV